MKMKPEDLALAIRVVELMPKGTKKDNYWNSVHRFDPAPGGLMLKTTDGGRYWIEWRVSVDGPALPLGANVECRKLVHLRPLLDAGRFSIEQDEEAKLLTIHKDQLIVRLPYESPDDDYPGPTEVPAATTWRFTTKTLAAALSFAHPFIDTEGNSDKTCVTLHSDGTLLTGSAARWLKIQGVCEKRQPDGEIGSVSFNAPEAKLVAGFLSNLGPNVSLTIFQNSGLYEFRDPVSGNRLVMAGRDAQFKLKPEQTNWSWDEVAHLDRNVLLKLAKTFPELSGHAGLNLTFRGEGDTASVKVATSGENEHQCSYEWPTFRSLADGVSTAPKTLTFNAQEVVEALRGMISISVAICSRDKYVAIMEKLDALEEDAVAEEFEDDTEAGGKQETEDSEVETTQDSDEPQAVVRYVIFPQKRKIPEETSAQHSTQPQTKHFRVKTTKTKTSQEHQMPSETVTMLKDLVQGQEPASSSEKSDSDN